ncbi:hypothetical protein ACFLSE_07320 [Bacteroidota bacterium]
MKKFAFLISVMLITLINTLRAQDIPEFGCTPDREIAFFTVEHFITSDSYAEARMETGTTGISVDEIRHLEDFAICASLDEIIEAHPDWKKIKEDTTVTRFFYRTDNFYFILWKRLSTIGGPKKLFLIVNKRFQVVGEYYL